jgi:phenylalanyl-tRNA synthetase beta chain
MKISIEWLKEYVDVPEDLERLKQDLSMIGLVVESVTTLEAVTVLELEVTSNRPDCLSHIGIAREIAALYDRPLRHPAVCLNLQCREDPVPFTVEIADPDLCPRYLGVVLDQIRVKPSPCWMQQRLESAGVRPVNNIVDATNYVLLEMGHPLHAFDFARLRRGKVVVARAADGQKIVTLDGVERQLDGEMLLINDGEGPVAIAGVMGGLHSEISNDTRTVLLECAYFEPASVRRTSKKLGLSTEASYRFERGADWDNTLAATARTCQLIEQLAGGRIAGSLQDVYPRRKEPVRITLQRRHAESLMGVSLTDEFVEATLGRLHFQLARTGEGAWQVTCPSYRPDMELEADLIEELARYYGYQNIPTTIPRNQSAGIASPAHQFESATRGILLGFGYTEAVNLSFEGESEHRRFPPLAGGRVALRNPLTEDTQFMRTTLAAGLVRSAKHNFNHGIRQVKLFEIGRVYCLGADGIPLEKDALGILGTGDDARPSWTHSSGNYDFFQLKGIVSGLFRGMRSAPADTLPTAEVPWLNPADAAALIVQGSCVGFLGSLHPELAEEYKLKQTIYLAEIDFRRLCEHVFCPASYVALPRYPPVERDFSIVVPRSLTYGEICGGISGLGIAELAHIELIDVYEGEKIPAGKLGMTLRLTFQDRERTLTVDRVQGFGDNIVNFLRVTYGAELR